ncbi:hypothetical protein J8J20_24225, partial [Mycobacterium tuberculosis]|nr:hypothetical protein [Mycobacterium tuberculosis]
DDEYDDDLDDEYDDADYDVDDEYDEDDDADGPGDVEDDYLDEVDGYENPTPRDRGSGAAGAEPAHAGDRGRTREARRSGASC